MMPALATLAQKDLGDYHKTYFRGLSEAPRHKGETPDREG